MSKTVEDVIASMEPVNESDIIRKKEVELWQDRVERSHAMMEERRENLSKTKNVHMGFHDPDRIKEIQKRSREYLEKAQLSKAFINQAFQGKVPYFPRNIILVAAQTGEGKSTTSANLAYHALMQGQKVLVIVNEETSDDVYNRVSCLINKWVYVNHNEFKPHQIDFFEKNIPALSERMIVVDDSYGGDIGQTSTIEGIEAVLNSLVNNNIKVDVIIIDYYQNIDSSIQNPRLKEWEVQGMFANFIDKFKNRYDAPIVLLAQKKKSDGEKTSFKELIEGRKAILNKATCAIEIKAERDKYRTAWEIKKSRFNQAVGETILTGYDKGRYVEYDEAFVNHVLCLQRQKEEAELMKNTKPGSK